MKKIIKDCQKILDEAFSKSNEIAGGINYRYLHGIRTMNACQKILGSPELVNKKVDKTILFVSALFHDIGKILNVETDGTLDGDRSKDLVSHEETGSRIVGNYLKDILSGKNIKKIAKIIKEQKKFNPKHIETKILKDADALDSIGLINVWRMFTYSANKHRSLESTFNYYRQNVHNNKNEKLYFSLTKKIANERRKKLKKFMSDLVKEYFYKDF